MKSKPKSISPLLQIEKKGINWKRTLFYMIVVMFTALIFISITFLALPSYAPHGINNTTTPTTTTSNTTESYTSTETQSTDGTTTAEESFSTVVESASNVKGGILGIVFSEASIIILPLASIGLIGVSGSKYISQNYFIKRRNLLEKWGTFGNLEISTFAKKAIIRTKIGIIVIKKEGMRYRITLPKESKEKISVFGFKDEKDHIVAYCSEDELEGILHLFFSYYNE